MGQEKRCIDGDEEQEHCHCKRNYYLCATFGGRWGVCTQIFTTAADSGLGSSAGAVPSSVSQGRLRKKLDSKQDRGGKEVS